MKKQELWALISVSDKDRIVPFAQAQIALGFKILSTGGTAGALAKAGIPVLDVEEIVGPPLFKDRVKTLSREVYAGILWRDIEEDIQELERLGIPRISLVCVNLYPLKATIRDSGDDRAKVIANTDVGGPSMLHGGAKAERIVVCDPNDYERVIVWQEAGCPDRQNFIDSLCAKADATVADYCLAAARHRSGGQFDGFVGERVLVCKGENEWQGPSALYRFLGNDDPLGMASFEQVAGKPISHNNLRDLERMLQTATHADAVWSKNKCGNPLIAVAAKHGNPCGASVGLLTQETIEGMIDGNRRAIFGGSIMTNFPISNFEAEALLHYNSDAPRRSLDMIVAPAFTEEALANLGQRSKCRLVKNPALLNLELDMAPRSSYLRGGPLIGPNYTYVYCFADTQVVCGDPANIPLEGMMLAWAICATSNSNTVTLVKDQMLIGNGVGQMDRVGCCELAVKIARDSGHSTQGAVAVSDSFFPEIDGPQVLIDAGISTILTTSGSVKDEKVIEVCRSAGITLVMVPDAEGRVFSWH